MSTNGYTLLLLSVMFFSLFRISMKLTWTELSALHAAVVVLRARHHGGVPSDLLVTTRRPNSRHVVALVIKVLLFDAGIVLSQSHRLSSGNVMEIRVGRQRQNGILRTAEVSFHVGVIFQIPRIDVIPRRRRGIGRAQRTVQSGIHRTLPSGRWYPIVWRRHSRYGRHCQKKKKI